MADVASFVNTTRARISAIIKVMEEAVALQNEFNALGGTAFSNTFNFSGENAAVYDITEAQFNASLVALGQLITTFQSGVPAANVNRARDLYLVKVN